MCLISPSPLNAKPLSYIYISTRLRVCMQGTVPVTTRTEQQGNSTG